MDELVFEQLGFGITCIDAAYVDQGMACFYLLEEDGECAVLETGTCHSVPMLLQLLHDRGIAPEQVRYVIPTHVHLDHAGGAGAMMAAFTEAQLLIHPRGARHMKDPEQLVAAAMAVYGEELFRELYGVIQPVAADRVRSMEDGETISLAGRLLEFRHTRGHAEHHFCVWDETSHGWFSGDMFGVSYPWCRFPTGDYLLPSTTPTQFDPESYLASLELLGRYAPQRMYLTHFGEMEYSREKALLLAHQINAYCELVQTGRGDEVLLQRRLTDYSMQLLSEFGVTNENSDVRDKLIFDMQLNTQGLMLWRKRVLGD